MGNLEILKGKRKNPKKFFLFLLSLFLSPFIVFCQQNQEDILRFFDYRSENLSYSLKLLSEEENLKIYELEFTSFVKSGYSENDRVHCFYFRPESSLKIPAIIIIHGYKARKLKIEKDIARKIARRKMAGIVFILPYHSLRKPKNITSGKFFISDDLKKVRETFRQSIIDIRCLIDWLEKREEIDGKRIGIIGISLGAIIANLAMGIDERLRAGVSVLGGGNFPEILRKSVLTIPLKIKMIWRGIDKETLGQNLAIIDPVTFSYRNRPRKVLMINGRLDLIIPPSCARDLWEALGKPEIKWLWSGHYSVLFIKEKIIRESLDYLERELKK